jgi:Family of unknown function (DUF6339)
MPYLTIFRNALVENLKTNVNANHEKYYRDDRWVLEVGTKSLRDLETRVELKGPLELEEPEAQDKKDLENAIRVHKALRQLTPVPARDPRVWTRLCHVEGWTYMRKRWDLERTKDDFEQGVRFITQRYFVAQSESRALLRNGIARLWWTAHLTHDPNRDNSYELTGVLFSTLDITQTILERSMGRAPVVLTGFLEFLLRNKDTLLTGGDTNRFRIRRLAKFLNMYGGVCLLDCMTQTELIRLLGTELERILASEPQKKKVAAKAK